MIRRERTVCAGRLTALLLAVCAAASTAAPLRTGENAPIRIPIELPIEVTGTGAVRTVTVEVSNEQAPKIRALWVQVHGLSYAGKASVQINDGDWIALTNESVAITEPDRRYGGIGGALSTLRLTLPIPAGNPPPLTYTVRFRMNVSDGVSSAFRVLAFNLLTDSGASALGPERFREEDPNTWQPPYPDPESIAEGERLWRTALLRENRFPAARVWKAHCMDCHAQDGRDLKYFNFSNASIAERAWFHGLTFEQGRLIASFIRTRRTPNPGRPWDPPYQPGPGLDARPLDAWSAGAGLMAVRERDSEMLDLLFPDGIGKEAVSVSDSLPLRELPLALPLPDWNRWLPREHPIDAWGDAFAASRLQTRYEGPEEGLVPRSLRDSLGRPDRPAYIRNGLLSDLIAWSQDRDDFLRPRIETIDGIQPPWTAAYARQVYGTAQWQLVKTWELMQEFELEGYGRLLLGDAAEVRTWLSDVAAAAAPDRLHIPDDFRAIGGSALTNAYFANAWRQTQGILNYGNRQQHGDTPLDWPAAYARLRTLQELAGPSEGLRLTALLVKGMQGADTGLGPDYPDGGWSPARNADISRLLLPASVDPWEELDSETGAAVIGAVLTSWLDYSAAYPPQQYYAGGWARPDELPGNDPDSGPWIDRIWGLVPLARARRVDDELLDRLCDWAADLWPLADWNSLKSRQ